jgi:hypothetical protein
MKEKRLTSLIIAIVQWWHQRTRAWALFSNVHVYLFETDQPKGINHGNRSRELSCSSSQEMHGSLPLINISVKCIIIVDGRNVFSL